MSIPQITQIKPTLSVSILNGGVTVHGFGRECNVNFSFKGIDESWAVHTDYGHIFGALGSIESCGDFFAPSPVRMNAEVVTPEDLQGRRWSFPRLISPYDSFSLHRGAQADGVSYLTPRRGYAVSAADCALIVAQSGSFIIAAHAGRNSIIDMEWIKGREKRRHESVVHAILAAFDHHGFERASVRVWIGFSISPGSHFEHAMFDEHNPHNERLIRHISDVYGKESFADDGVGRTRGLLDIKELIRRQFFLAGVPGKNIELDSVCTYSDRREGEYLWYSNKRQLVAGEEQGRNLFVVVVN